MTSEEAKALIDAYLLGERSDRERVFSQLTTLQSEKEAALPILRAIALIGARAADESLMALRLALGTSPTSDKAIREIRSALADLSKGNASGRERYLAIVGAP